MPAGCIFSGSKGNCEADYSSTTILAWCMPNQRDRNCETDYSCTSTVCTIGHALWHGACDNNNNGHFCAAVSCSDDKRCKTDYSCMSTCTKLKMSVTTAVVRTVRLLNTYSTKYLFLHIHYWNNSNKKKQKKGGVKLSRGSVGTFKTTIAAEVWKHGG